MTIPYRLILLKQFTQEGGGRGDRGISLAVVDSQSYALAVRVLMVALPLE